METAGETIVEDGLADIPAFESPDDDVTTEGHGDLDDERNDALYFLNDGPSAGDHILQPVTNEDFAVAQATEPFCVKIRQHINTGAKSALELRPTGLLS